MAAAKKRESLSKEKATREGKTEESATSSFSEDLKNQALEAARQLADKFVPDEETRSEISRIAMEILPDKEEVDKSLSKIQKDFSPEIELVKKLKDKIIPEEELRDKVDKIKTAAKNIKNAKDEKAEEKKFKDTSLISDYDIHLFKEGKHFHLYKKFGSHLMTQNGVKGVYFALWAPNAKQVSVIGDFNEWKKMAHPMKSRPDESGIWEVFIPEAKKGSLYKYFLRSTNGYEAEKGDPFAFMWETPPKTASVVWDLDSKWNDGEWMKDRKEKAGKPAPVSVYEMHIGSWKRVPEDGFRSLSYREMAKELPGYLKEMGFTHVEFMPVMEHPFFGSWGYQITGYFAPSSRFGNPQDFMFLIDALHQAGIGIILDWVPSHFPSDLHGLHYFDGTYLYEHEDPQKGFHPDWQSYIFNYGRNEVRSFLISNALFWLEKFHADGLRVDAVASMLYLDYSRKHGEWEPNKHGGNENLEAISFLKEFNEVVYAEFPDVITIAEESTAWPNVSKPTYMGGLGFGMKWMMGWMHDTLEYFKKDPIHRKHHQNTITFSTTYAFSENFMLPLSHDEVVYGKQALLNKMPGDNWNKFANLRALYSYMYAHSGTKLLFMGAEFAQIEEWDHDSSLDWHLTEQNSHKGIQQLISRLNELYKTEPALYEKSFEHDGFEWVDFNDTGNSVISFLRKGNNHLDTILVVANLTPVTRENYRIGVPEAGNWKEIFNSDNEKYGGSGVRNEEVFHSQKLPLHNKNNSVEITLPPMAVLYLKKKAIPL
ncbi:1,4-alpha-glucan branching protein GlgB [Antarcticibacterium arcticum]|uniref:1,4-alpha-glucan branching enzyme GlgB n=1 Tax=Antarcticibacterium arcticum TaxID=2585771 RepID=A0A5B8YM38_9FLAO|nr:1,4-alpha-glucan branching protein GlgB [Antarcticibacterium arcticum]